MTGKRLAVSVLVCGVLAGLIGYYTHRLYRIVSLAWWHNVETMHLMQGGER